MCRRRGEGRGEKLEVDVQLASNSHTFLGETTRERWEASQRAEGGQ